MKRVLALLVLTLISPVLVFAQIPPQMILEPGVVPVIEGAIAVYDFDSDGDDDFALTGRKRNGSPSLYERDYYVLTIYQSEANGLVDVTPEYTVGGGGLPFGFGEAPKLLWVDLDGDGDGDLIATGTILSPEFSYVSDDPLRDWTVKVYRNDDGTFVDASEGLPSVSLGTLSFGLEADNRSLSVADIDGDGRLDLHVSARTRGGMWEDENQEIGGVFVSRGDRFERWAVPLPSRFWSIAGVVDLDLDGDGDLVAVSSDGHWLLRNDGGVFVDTVIEIPRGRRHWVDLDGDGDLDLHLVDAGTILRNDGNGLVFTGFTVPALLSVGSVDWSDVDGDERLDVLLVGRTAAGTEIAELYRDTGAGYTRAEGFEAWSGGVGAFADLAGDGFPDVVVAASHGVRIHRNQGGVVHSLPTMQPLYEPMASWADLDSDGNRDLLLMGVGLDLLPSAHLYRNDGGTLTEIACPVPQFMGDAAVWFDVDNDGDVDLVLAARDADYAPVTLLYWNDAGTLRLASQALPEIGGEAVLAAVDFDNDGWTDLSMAGRGKTHLLRNDRGTFVDSGIVLPGLVQPSLAWADFDGDGDFDLALGGFQDQLGTGLYRNEEGTLVRDARLQFLEAPVDWVDLTGDGQLELVDGSFAVYCVLPDSAVVLHARLSLPLRAVERAWSDLDGDGDLDVITTVGRMDRGVESLWSYTAAGFYSEAGFEWANLSDVGVGVSVDNLAYAFSGHASLDFVDWDGDGDRDLHLAGIAELGPMHWTWTVRSDPPNQPPDRPRNLRATTDGERVTFHWDAAEDDRTPAASLTYNLVVGTSPGASDLMSAAADPSTGIRYASGPGNVGPALQWTLSLDAPGPYFWGVQAVDQEEIGGAFELTSGDPTSIAIDPPQTAPTLRTAIGTTYPNPFNPRLTIEYSVDRLQRIELAVFDLSGRRVRTLFSGPCDAAEYSTIWDGSDENGSAVATGTYLVRLSGDQLRDSRKIVLVR